MKVKSLAIVGAGGFGRELAGMIEQLNQFDPQWEIVGFYDDGYKKGTKVNDYYVLGSINDLNSTSEEVCVAIAIGDSKTRHSIKAKLYNPQISYPVLIHPSALVGKFINIGEGTIITANNVLTVNINLGNFVLLNLACTVGHDTLLEDFTSFMPSVNISGGVIVREGAFIGTGAQILNHLEIGAWTKIGAGAVVKESLPAHCTAVGIPAKPIKFHE